MPSPSSSITVTGIGFFGLLTIVFITLKLTHVIDWSWLWVLCPLVAPFALTLLILIITFICCAIAELFTTVFGGARRRNW